MENHYRKILKDTDERILQILRTQEIDSKSPYYGGFYDKAQIIQARQAIYQVAALITVYANEDSRFYHNELLFERVMLGLSYIKSVQHENGLFDYITCNFQSAPDTAFCIVAWVPIVEYFRQKEGRTDKESTILFEIDAVVKAGSFGLLEGGFHTPNHRWAIASLLAKGSELYQDDTLKKGVYQYLQEGIDGNEDGEYAEKSAGVYNGVNNDAMIMLSESLKDDQYDQYALRNLKLMLHYWEPDGSVFTANSTRFDKDLIVYPLGYYIEYLKMGYKYNNKEFLQMCNRIMDIVEEKQIQSPDCLIQFMLHKEYRTLEVEGSYEVKNFKKHFEWSGIYRARSGNFTYTVMKGESNFLYFHNGTIKLAMKLAGSFCEHRAFKSETMEILPDGTVHLHQVMKGWYYLPFEEKPDTSDWWQMKNENRKKKLGPDMDIHVYIMEAENGLDVRLKTAGVEGAPWRVEMAFNGVDYMANNYLGLPVTGSEVLVVREGMLEAYNEKDSVTIGPGFGEHRFTEGKEDSEAKTAGAATVYFTDYTGFDRTIQIRNKRDIQEIELAKQVGR